MFARPLFVGVDIQFGSTQVLALDADGHVALRTYLPRTDEVEVGQCLVDVLAVLSQAHGRAPLVLSVDGHREAVRIVHDLVGEHLAAPFQWVRGRAGGPPVEVLSQDAWAGLYRDAWRLALLAALRRTLPDEDDA